MQRQYISPKGRVAGEHTQSCRRGQRISGVVAVLETGFVVTGTIDVVDSLPASLAYVFLNLPRGSISPKRVTYTALERHEVESAVRIFVV